VTTSLDVAAGESNMRKFGLRIVLVIAAVVTALAAPGVASASDDGEGPDVVTIGAFINDVQEVDLENHYYLVDFYVWFRWTNPDIDPVASMEVMNPTEAWGLLVTPSYEEPLEADDGSLYNVVRYQGKFNNKLPLQKYPFDKQDLIIELEDNASNSSQLVYVADDPGVVSNPNMSLPGWILGDPTLTAFDNQYTTTFGVPGATEGETYSRVLIEIPVERPAFTSGVKLFFPLLLVLLTTVLTFLMRPSMTEARIGTAITALLTLVALQLTVNDTLPAVEYLMMIDVIYACSYLFVIFTMGAAVYAAWTSHGEDTAAGVRFDRRMLMYGLIGYFALVIGTIVIFLA
jgi:hypothetical protein